MQQRVRSRSSSIVNHMHVNEWITCNDETEYHDITLTAARVLTDKILLTCVNRIDWMWNKILLIVVFKAVRVTVICLWHAIKGPIYHPTNTAHLMYWLANIWIPLQHKITFINKNFFTLTNWGLYLPFY